MIAGGNIKVNDIVTHTFDLDHITEAFETFEKRIGGAMKVVIYPNGGKSSVWCMAPTKGHK